MEADWDLQAVVRGCTTTTSTVEDPFSCFAPFSQEQEDQLFCFPDLCETNTVIEELENMYKPFFPIFQPLTPPTIPTSISMSFGGLKEQQQRIQQQQQQKQKPQESLTGSASATTTTTTTITHSQTPRSKKRKNQQKKVVCQVPVEGLSSDMWAWRKYGQKPIKGSPYPRSYYKCSSSKGCPARKQVERSRSDPAMFIITYTAEHNHSVPTHRNSLAGSTRQKFSTTQGSSAAEKPSCSSSSPTLSPTTSLTPSMEDELLQETKLESKEDEEEEEMVGLEQEDELLIPDMVITDDFFTGLEEFTGITSTSATTTTTTTTGGGATSLAFEDCFSDLFPANIPSVWLTNNAATAAGRS